MFYVLENYLEKSTIFKSNDSGENDENVGEDDDNIIRLLPAHRLKIEKLLLLRKKVKELYTDERCNAFYDKQEEKLKVQRVK